MTQPDVCLICDAKQQGQRHFCASCGGLTSRCRKELSPYEPVDLLVRWEAGSLYRGKIVLGTEEPLDEATKAPEVWIFTYDEEMVNTPALIRLQQEDRKLAQLPHPNLPKQLDRGHVGHRPYMIFEGKDMAMPLPTWRPNLPNHVLSKIFSRLAELVLLLQSAGIQRPVIDPFRLMIFWDEEADLLDFQWLPLPELGNYLYREGFAPTAPQDEGQTSPQTKAVSDALLHLEEPAWTTKALHDPAHSQGELRVARGPILPEEEEESQRETTMIQKVSELDLPAAPASAAHPALQPSTPSLDATPDVSARIPDSLKHISGKLAETDDFELMTMLEELGESSDDLEALAKRLAALEQEGRIPSDELDAAEQAVAADGEFIDAGDDPDDEGDTGDTDNSHVAAAIKEAFDSQEVEAAKADAEIGLSVGATQEHTPGHDEMITLRETAESIHTLLEEAVTERVEPKSGSDPSIQEITGAQLAVLPTPTKMPLMSGEDLFRALHPPDDEPTQPGTAVGLRQAPQLEGEGSLAPDIAVDDVESVEVAPPEFLSLPNSLTAIGAALLAQQKANEDVALHGQLVVHHHEKMQVNQIHSLDVRLQPEGTPQQSKDAPLGVQVTPVFPGCIVSPTSAHLARWDEQIRFWITPIVAGDLRESAALHIQAGQSPVSAIALPCVSYKANIPWILTIIALSMAMVAMIPPPTSGTGLLGALWLFFHRWGLIIVGGFGITAMVTGWWPQPLTPSVTRTTFSME